MTSSSIYRTYVRSLSSRLAPRMLSTSSPHQRRVDLVLFDIFDTLLRPRQPPHVQYALEARRILSPVLPSSTSDLVSDDAVKARFSSAFRSMAREHPNYGKGSSPSLSPDQWWEGVIRRTFDVGSSGKEVEARMAELVQRLLDRFASREAYEAYDDALPSLRLLSDAASTSASSLPRLGIASNSDERILSVLQDLDFDRFVSVRAGQQEGTTDDKGRATPTLSYTIGHAKPDARFFRTAVRRAYPFSTSQPSEEEVSMACSRTLYVGDSYEEDYVGATEAGLMAFWLDRSMQGGGNQPGNDAPKREPAGARIQSLEEAARWALGEE